MLFSEISLRSSQCLDGINKNLIGKCRVYTTGVVFAGMVLIVLLIFYHTYLLVLVNKLDE